MTTLCNLVHDVFFESLHILTKDWLLWRFWGTTNVCNLESDRQIGLPSLEVFCMMLHMVVWVETFKIMFKLVSFQGDAMVLSLDFVQIWCGAKNSFMWYDFE
jgi:hypothetical protein